MVKIHLKIRDFLLAIDTRRQTDTKKQPFLSSWRGGLSGFKMIRSLHFVREQLTSIALCASEPF